jgi:hypothetical protein
MKTTTIRLSKSDRVKLETFGGGSMSKGVRRMILALDQLTDMEAATPEIELRKALDIVIRRES